MTKKYDDIFSHVDTIHQSTNRHRMTAKTALMHSDAQAKILQISPKTSNKKAET